MPNLMQLLNPIYTKFLILSIKRFRNKQPFLVYNQFVIWKPLTLRPPLAILPSSYFLWDRGSVQQAPALPLMAEYTFQTVREALFLVRTSRQQDFSQNGPMLQQCLLLPASVHQHCQVPSSRHVS